MRHPIDRRQFIAALGATSFGVLLAGCGARDEEPAAPLPAATAGGATTVATTEGPLKKGLAEGMYGGPTGFPGAERYQYPLDSEEGRAIAALRQLRRDRKAPDTLIVQVFAFLRPQFEHAYPDGAPSQVQLFEEETGVKIELVEVEGYQENLRNAETRNGSFDVVMSFFEEPGDFAEAGLLRPLDDLVERHRPSWLDPVYGLSGGESTVTLVTKYKGSTYVVPFDIDPQPYFYRGDLMDSPEEQAAFADRHGRPLRFPLTWDEQAEVAEFFTRPGADPPLYGDVATLAPGLGIVNWKQRFVCSGNPNMLYFNDDASANVDNEAGIRAFEELLRSLEWHPSQALDQDFFVQWQLMRDCAGWGGGSYPALTKLLAGSPNPSTGCGRHIRSEVSPGRIVDGALIRRPVVTGGTYCGVNAFADRSRQEAAYLFLQWIGGARVHTWLGFSPHGVLDPHHVYALGDPYVAQSYGPQPAEQLIENIIPRSAPAVSLKGGYAYGDALSEELQKVLRKEQTPEQAAKALQDRWDRITEEQGVETQVEALKTFFEGFPQIRDTPGQELPVEEVSTAVS